MKKFLNDPKRYTEDYLSGILSAYPDKLTRNGDDSRALYTTKRRSDKVAIVTGGGSGHLPLFLGYVGDGLCDACAVGNVFASPSYLTIIEAARAVESGAGVLLLYGNYGGDRINFDLAAKELSTTGIHVEQIWGTDDVTSAPNDRRDNRRGVAGLILVYKVAGAAAARNMSLAEVVQVTRKANESIRSIGVAMSSCTLPEVGRPSFEIADDEMEIGMGIHGEPGVRRTKVMTADEVAQIMVSTVLEDMMIPARSRVAVLVNLLGSTPLEEGYIFYGSVSKLLKENEIIVAKVRVGEYCTSMEMAGLSLSIMLLDDELESLLDDPASSPFVSFEKGWG